MDRNVNDPSSTQNAHHQRAMAILLGQPSNELTVDAIPEDSAPRSAWSPDHEFERDQQRPVTFATLGETFARRFTTITQQPEFWNKIVTQKTRRKVGWLESLRNVALSSWLNILFVFIPVAWTVHFMKVSSAIKFSTAFVALIPLCRMLEYGGENLALYCGKDLGDLICVTLNNAVEAILAIILLSKCELRLLQATLIGVILLRLLLIPGVSFIIGGARNQHQILHPHSTGLNQSLLTTGVLLLILPLAFFNALDRGPTAETVYGQIVTSDATRGQILQFSRGMSFILLLVYISSRFFIHVPVGQKAGLHNHEDTPEAYKKAIEEAQEEDPEVNVWVCAITLLFTTAATAVTAEFLVDSVEGVRRYVSFNEEWFGLIVLPVVSYSADAILSIGYFIRSFWKKDAPLPKTIANYRTIDLSIQFMLFWTPTIVLLGWFTHKPMSLLFDSFEIAILLGGCFLVNYVTADSKTNWAEGVMLVAFYVTMALTAWYYPGQPSIKAMSSCETVASFAESRPAFAATLPTVTITAAPSRTSISKAGKDDEEDGGDEDDEDKATPSAKETVVITTRPRPEDSVPLNQKLQALLALYDVLLSGELDETAGTEEDSV